MGEGWKRAVAAAKATRTMTPKKQAKGKVAKLHHEAKRQSPFKGPSALASAWRVGFMYGYMHAQKEAPKSPTPRRKGKHE